MAQEIELKLALPEEAQRALLRHPLLRKALDRQSCRLINLYYDTPELALRQCAMALRLRAQGRRWLQTVKCAGNTGGGLATRTEWETPYTGHFDFSAIDDENVRAWLTRPKLAARIGPVFETNFLRTTWNFAPVPGTRIEMAFDRGWIAAAGRREAISEIELELKEGDPAQLFALAGELAKHLPIAPAPLSKADRGYRLFLQTPPAPVKAAVIPLTAIDTPLAAFTRIAFACLDQLQQNHAGAIGSEDPEYIHQMRVAMRRLRAALRLFRPLLPTGFPAAVATPLRKLMRVLGQARDLDVLLAEIATPVSQALPDEPRLAALVGVITAHGFDRRRAAVDYLRSPRCGAAVLEALALLHGVAQKVGCGDTAMAPSLTDFAGQRLRRLRKKVLALAAQADSNDPASLHALRIGIKRLRYALEFFAPLAEPKALRKLLDHLTALQDTLGQINDLANAGALLMDCAGSDAHLREAVTLIGGWHGPRHQALLAAVPLGLKRLGKLRLPKLAGAD